MKNEAQEKTKIIEKLIISPENPEKTENKCSNIRKVLYDFFDDPKTTIAKIYAFFKTFLILLSVTTLCMQSMSYFKTKGEVKNILVWMCIEGVVASVFTFEYIIRFFIIVVDFKSFVNFLISVWNFIDVLSFAPFWLELVLFMFMGAKFNIEYLGILRTLRMFRLFKFWKATQRVEKLFLAIKNSSMILISIFCIYGVLIVIFSTFVYHFEKGEYNPNTKQMMVGDSVSKFTSIVQTFWWSIVTLPTLGYGDMVPLTAMGQVFCGVFIILTMALISLPSLVIGNNLEDLEKGDDEDDEEESVYEKLKKNEKKMEKLLKKMELILDQNMLIKKEILKKRDEKNDLVPDNI